MWGPCPADLAPDPRVVRTMMAMVTSESTGHTFSAELARRVLLDACGAVDLPAAGAELIRLGENALFRLPRADVIVRIARTMSYWPDVVNEVHVSRWLASEHFPAAQVCDVAQPIMVQGHPTTFWRLIPGRPGGPTDLAALGSVLRRLHSLPRPTSFTLPCERILDRVGTRIDQAPIASTDREFLSNRLDVLTRRVQALRFPHPPAPTHGDAHSDNLMFVAEQPVLIDFERFAWGQPEWDLAMTATEFDVAGWWSARQYAEFVDAYGWDVMAWTQGYETLRDVHAIKMTTWLMQNVAESRDIAEEFQVRMETLRSGSRPAGQWRPF